MNNALTSFLHLVKPSGHLIYGQDNLTPRNGFKIKLIILVKDASQNTQKKVLDYAAHKNISTRIINRESLIGFLGDKKTTVIAITSKNIAVKVENILKEGDTYE